MANRPRDFVALNGESALLHLQIAIRNLPVAPHTNKGSTLP
jgi:hypothetical protein